MPIHGGRSLRTVQNGSGEEKATGIIFHNSFYTVLTHRLRCFFRNLYYTACADFSNVVAQRHTFGGADPGGYDLQIQTRPRILYNAPTHKFHHPMFTRSEVIVLTNKQINRCH